jgi:hypothetical protein
MCYASVHLVVRQPICSSSGWRGSASPSSTFIAERCRGAKSKFEISGLLGSEGRSRSMCIGPFFLVLLLFFSFSFERDSAFSSDSILFALILPFLLLFLADFFFGVETEASGTARGLFAFTTNGVRDRIAL